MLKRILHIISHPVSLSLIIGIAIILSIPSPFSKYKIKVENLNIKPKTEKIYYHDFDDDGNSERIVLYAHTDHKQSILIDSDGIIVNQWGLDGKSQKNPSLIFGDYNDDNLDEIYVFTNYIDSIFINVFCPFNKKSTLYKNRFIDKYYKYSDKYEATVHIDSCDFNDINKDGLKEVVFLISAGYSLHPRSLFAFDLKNNHLFKSPFTGTGIGFPVSYDIDNDGNIEYILETYAHGNWEENVPFSDNYSWLMVLDKNLDFKFKPIRYGIYKSRIQVLPFKPSNKTYLMLLKKHGGIENIDNELILLNCNGIELKKRKFGQSIDLKYSCLLSNDIQKRNKIFLVHNNGKILEIDSNLFFVDSTFVEGISDGRIIKRIDIDLDGKEEFIFWGLNMQQIIITRNDFTNPAYFNFKNDSKIHKPIISLIKRNNAPPKLYINDGSNEYFLLYAKDPVYPFRFLIYLSFILALYLILLFFQKTQQIRVMRKYENLRKINELQLKTVKNQIDPHFTLNLINSIGALFYKRDKEKASYVLSKYTRLLRTTIINSDNIENTLEEEISYVKNYLDLEKFRYNDKFDYKINVEDSVDQNIKIPKMLIHSFVENAVKHGIKHLNKNGLITITLKREKSYHVIFVQDNGVGRKKASEYSFHDTGKGIKIIDEMISLYYQLKKVKIFYKINDLYDNNIANGTLVKILIRN